MTNNLDTTKRRLSQYLKSKRITQQTFFSETGIKRGFLDSDKLEMSVSDDNLAKIFAVYTDIEPMWLISGQGPMLKEPNSGIIQTSNNGATSATINHASCPGSKCTICDEKDRRIEELKAQIEEKDAQIKSLLDILKK